MNIQDMLELSSEEYRAYRRRNGRHFTRELCEFAVGMMTKEDGQPIKPLTKMEVDRLLQNAGVDVEHAKGYDTVFVANMGMADYLGESVPDMDHLAKYVKNVIDDPDGYEGIAFNRWYADMCAKRIEVPWDRC